MLPPLQAPSFTLPASPRVHLAALTSHLCTAASESLFHVSQNHASLLRKPPKSLCSLGARAPPPPPGDRHRPPKGCSDSTSSCSPLPTATATWAPPVSGTASGLALCLGCPPPTEPHGSGSHSPKVPIQRSLFRKYLPCSFHMKQLILSLPSSFAHWACFTFSSFSCCLH